MHHVFFVLLLCCLTELTNTAAQRVCPNVKPGDKAFRLDVSNSNITLPNGKFLRGLLYNDSYIGPLIAADLGDEVSVDVVNNADVGTSVHWHGMDLPDAAWADGVDTVTQRPIAPGDTFRYKFKAEPAGTLWYHSHVGMQFADGLRGPLIVTVRDVRRWIHTWGCGDITTLIKGVMVQPGQQFFVGLTRPCNLHMSHSQLAECLHPQHPMSLCLHELASRSLCCVLAPTHRTLRTLTRISTTRRWCCCSPTKAVNREMQSSKPCNRCIDPQLDGGRRGYSSVGSVPQHCVQTSDASPCKQAQRR